jgi:hypothetical protein
MDDRSYIDGRRDAIRDAKAILVARAANPEFNNPIYKMAIEHAIDLVSVFEVSPATFDKKYYDMWLGDKK